MPNLKETQLRARAPRRTSNVDPRNVRPRALQDAHFERQ